MTTFAYVKKMDSMLAKATMLETKSLHVFYGTHQALTNIDLTLHEQTITAFIGPSGCGKSTLLRCLNRMNDTIANAKVDGEILIDGVNINTPNLNATQLRRYVGMVFQRPNPFLKSIYENIAFAPRLHGVPNKELPNLVEESLRRVGLWNEVKDRLKESALRLSGGQQQRLCIARTIAMKPKIILFDEPTSALDPISTAKIETLIQDLKEEFTIAIVTHNMQQAARISDYTAYFYLGKMIEYGLTEQIFRSPQKQQTADYLQGKMG